MGSCVCSGAQGGEGSFQELKRHVDGRTVQNRERLPGPPASQRKGMVGILQDELLRIMYLEALHAL